ncbi:MAG: homoserine dehydrogenase [Sphingomonadales bacterium]
MAEAFRIALAGLGTVGVGVLRLLERNAALIAERAGRPIEVVAVSARDRQRDRGIATDHLRWHDDATLLAQADDVDGVVELMGGSDGPALALARSTLEAGKPFVTANKAMIAHHGHALASLAERHGAGLRFEAAVAGGIPILKALRHGLAANRINSVYGILNGTCNYILTVMERDGRDFDDVLMEAQQLGYAEADPSFDIDGIDTAHKLAILAALAFNSVVHFDAVAVEGIRQISPIDIDYALELGYRIKLLGIANRLDGEIEQRVHPCLVAEEHPLAQVDGSMNAVVAEGDFVGRTVFEGAGAGAGPTASSVVADLIDIVRGEAGPAFSVPVGGLTALRPMDLDTHVGRYYVRLTVKDQPGVVADVAAILRDEGVSMASLIQKDGGPKDSVFLVLTTHETLEAGIVRGLAQFAALDSVIADPVMLRIKAL